MSLDDPLTFAHGPAWRDRLALAPLTNLQSGPDGVLSDDEYAWLVRRGEGGFGLVMTCAAYVRDDGHTFPGQLGAAGPQHLAGLTRLADGIRATGAVSSIQLQHGGRRADGALGPVVAPWDDPAKGATALTTGGVEQVVADFAAAAALAERAGFDGAEIHGAHGYLLAQFLDARNNQRTDRYGGSAENRRRVILEVIDAVRGATGPDFQLGLRLSPERYGIPLGDAVALARDVLGAARIDYLDLSLWDAFKAPAEPEYARTTLLSHFTRLPRGDVRLGAAGKILSAADAAAITARCADFALIGTAAIIHHDFAARALADPGFVSDPQPVSAQRLCDESVGPAFLEYLSTGWDDFVA
ncbi:NADH:flavin oxidoreductase [Gordonia sp. PP30]|uniref:oxidoreductase n=1 Tax=Gordonia sp. PP30 TaxID=2935861 RepID=UPI001FFFF037|nr:NADH:flavin oxidoreductase [Gordonia sp. PP30]UQE76859.1 NADH:flavin oxidoreductase [Gordonia sp. PP30]